uniref:Uncharacterized protein n=1 Tax=Anguilla anguilla TaxID=7936 RepID=A0A0E9RL17_ANGAN
MSFFDSLNVCAFMLANQNIISDLKQASKCISA